MSVNTIAYSVFGQDYIISQVEELDNLEILTGRSARAQYKANDQVSSILPPGAYVVKYLSGKFMSTVTKQYIIGGIGGLKVSWKQTDSNEWTNIFYPPLAIDQDEAPEQLSQFVWVEFTKPHELMIHPPDKSIGQVTVGISRYVPRHYSQFSKMAIIGMSKENKIEKVITQMLLKPRQWSK